METLLELLPIISGFLCGGGLISLFTVKLDKKLKDILNSTSVIALHKELIEELKQEKEDALAKLKLCNTIIEDLLNENDLLRHDKATLLVEFDLLKLFYEHANSIRCDVINCKLRLPPMEKDTIKLLKKLQPKPEEPKKEEDEEIGYNDRGEDLLRGRGFDS